MELFDILDLLGTLAFAISGAIVAMRKKFDPFGIFIIAFVTALGGGTLRDVFMGKHPMGWMLDVNYVYIIILGTFIAILFRKRISYLNKSLFLFDTIGLGVFTIIGTEIGIANNLSPIISIALGTISAAFGGVIRDVLCGEIPVIFRKEIYATACLIGASLLLLFNIFNIAQNISYITTIILIIIVRILAVRFKLSLPQIKLR